MTIVQNCDLCGINQASVNDHCHYHNVPRGKLCHRCNILIGRVDQNLVILAEWVNDQTISKYRERCEVCGTRPIPEIIMEYKTTVSSLSDLAVRPVATLPDAKERIRLRKAFGVTQTLLAKRLKVSRKTIWEWERGETEPTGRNRELYAELIALWQDAERENRQTGKGN